MRIEIKRLRYTLEIYDPLYKNKFVETIEICKKLQKMFGDIHDCDVWLAYLPGFITKEINRTQRYFGHIKHFSKIKQGIHYLQDELQKNRMKYYKILVNECGKLKKQNFWQNLKSAV